MRKLILFLSLSLFFVSCNPQGGGGTQPQPYKRPFPTKAYYNGDLTASYQLDSNEKIVAITTYGSSEKQYSIVYDNQSRIDSVYRLFNGRKLGTYWSYPAIDSIYMRRFDDTTWDYDYGLKYSPTHLEYISTATSRDYEFDLSGDTITKSEWITNQNPYVLYKQEANVLGDSINPLWLEENPLFSWYYLWILDEVFSSKMPISTDNIGGNGGTIYDNFYDAQGRLIERRAINSSGSTYTMELSYN
jgi:hypothetical protein